jgi:hypothetical protein
VQYAYFTFPGGLRASAELAYSTGASR